MGALQRPPRHAAVRHAGAGLLTASGAAVVVGTSMPWLRSGRRWRSSYDLFGLLHRIGLAPDGAIGALVRWWPLVPTLVVAAVLLGWWAHRALAAVAAVLAAAWAGGVSVAVLAAASGTPIDTGWGPVVCAAGSAAMLVGATLVATSAGARRRPRSDSCHTPSVPSPHADPL